MNAETVSIDCKGMQCPAPILAVAKAARKASGPMRLEVFADDGDFPVDIEAWCKSTGATLDSIDNAGGVYIAQVSIGDVEGATTTKAPAPREAGSGRVAVDCVGMKCPAPILQVAKAARKAEGPSVLAVSADDGDFPVDIEAWCKSTGATLFSIDDDGGTFEALIGLNGATSPDPVPELRTVEEPAPSSDAPESLYPDAEVYLDLRNQPSGAALLRLGQVVMDAGSVTVHGDLSLRKPLETWASAIGAGLEVAFQQDRSIRAQVFLGPAPPQVVATPAPRRRSIAPPAEMETESSAPLREALPAAPVVPRENKAVFLVLHNDFESLMAAMMVANASAAQGMDTEVFFSFWGVNVLRSTEPKRSKSNELAPRTPFLKRMMKWMMPAGPRNQTMSKMHMGGMGLGMMKYFMSQQNVLPLEELMNQAVELDVKFTVCTMSMGIMGISKDDLMELPNIQYGGVTSFTSNARTAATSMVF